MKSLKKLYLLLVVLGILLTSLAPIYGEELSHKEIAKEFEKKNPHLFDDGDMNKPIIEDGWIYYLSDRIDSLMSLGIPRKVSVDGERTYEALSMQDAYLHSKFQKIGDYLYYEIVKENKYEPFKIKPQLYRVKIDGSDKGVVAPVYDYQIYKDKVYFQNSHDLKDYSAKYYSGNLDGTNLKKLSDKASGLIAIYNDRMYYKNTDDNLVNSTVYSMKFDGSDVKKESFLREDHIYKFANNYHLNNVGQDVNVITNEKDKLKKNFRNTSWGMTMAEVLEVENIPNPIDYDWISYKTKIYGKDVSLEFRFDEENKLSSGSYSIVSVDLTLKLLKEFQILFKAAEKDLNEKYGEAGYKSERQMKWYTDDTEIWLRIVENAGFILSYHPIDKELEYKNPPKSLNINSIKSIKNKDKNLENIKKYLKYNKIDEGWIYYSEYIDGSTQDLIISSEDKIYPDLDAVISIQHFGKENSPIRNTLKQTLKFYFPKDYKKVYEIIEKAYPGEEIPEEYAFKNLDSNIRHKLDLITENYIPNMKEFKDINKNHVFDSKAVSFKFSNKYNLLEIYIGK